MQSKVHNDELIFVYVIHILELLYDIQYKVFNLTSKNKHDGCKWVSTRWHTYHVWGYITCSNTYCFFFGSFWILQIVGNVKTHVSHYTHNTLWAPQ